MRGPFLERGANRLAIETANSAAEGLAVLADRGVGVDGIDCVVSDYDMPERNGIEFLGAVRGEYPDLPFVLFTGKGSEEIASEAISVGVSDYLQKGSGTEQYDLLANRVTNLARARRSDRMLEERTRRLETLIGNLPGMVYRCRNEPGWPMETVEGEVNALTGHTAGALESGSVNWEDDVIHPEDRESMWSAVQAALDDGEGFEVTYRIVTVAGETKWMWERGRAVHGDDEEVTALEGFITDITERKER